MKDRRITVGITVREGIRDISDVLVAKSVDPGDSMAVLDKTVHHVLEMVTEEVDEFDGHGKLEGEEQ